MGQVHHSDVPAADQNHGGLCNLLLGHVFEGVMSRKIASRENIGHQDQSVVHDPFWSLHSRRVCQWNAHLTHLSPILACRVGAIHIPLGPHLEPPSQTICFWSIWKRNLACNRSSPHCRPSIRVGYKSKLRGVTDQDSVKGETI